MTKNEEPSAVQRALQECFAGLGCRAGDLPASECAAKTSLALPIYPELTEEMMGTVVSAILDFCREGAGASAGACELG